MSFRDDDIEARLRAFLAHEAQMDEDIRSRIWDQITRADPEAAFWLDDLQRNARVRQIRRRPPRPSRILAVAAVLVLLAIVQMVVRSGPSEEPFVQVGPSTTVPTPRDLDEFADGVAVVGGTVLGETEDTRFTYLRGIRTTRPDDLSRPVVISHEQRWVADDGSGREVIDVEGSGRASDVYVRGPGVLQIGFLPPETALALPDDADVVLATFIRDTVVPGESLNPFALVDLLTYKGVPGPARAGALRALDRLGFEPAPGPAPGPNLWRVEGSGPDGLRVQADFDLRTGAVVGWTRLLPGGGYVRLTNIEVDLRRDTRGS